MVVLLAWLIAIPLLGFLTGSRTMVPMAVLSWFAYAGHMGVRHEWAFWVAKPVTAIVFTVLAIGELIGDKMPFTPNRTSPFALIGRICFGGLVGALCATCLHSAWIEGALLGAAGALVGTFVGFHIRQWLVQQRGFKDLHVALVEDFFVIGLSILAMGFVTA